MPTTTTTTTSGKSHSPKRRVSRAQRSSNKKSSATGKPSQPQANYPTAKKLFQKTKQLSTASVQKENQNSSCFSSSQKGEQEQRDVLSQLTNLLNLTSQPEMASSQEASLELQDNEKYTAEDMP